MDKEDDRIYIGELSRIVNRRVRTIHAWHRLNKLPEHLLPQRGARNTRWWTKEQVYGPDGIIAWMRENDMRPGNLLSDPDEEERHINNLRKPKYLTGHHIRSAKHFADSGKSREFIVAKIYPRTRYSAPEKLEKVLVKLFEQNGWKFPPAQRNGHAKLSKTQQRELAGLEKKISSL